MNELTVVEKATEWQRLTRLVLDSVSSPITKRVYLMALNEFFGWYAQEPRPGFTKATVSAWRVTLEERGLGVVVDHRPHVGHPQAGRGGNGQWPARAGTGGGHPAREERQVHRRACRKLAVA